MTHLDSTTQIFAQPPCAAAKQVPVVEAVRSDLREIRPDLVRGAIPGPIMAGNEQCRAVTGSTVYPIANITSGVHPVTVISTLYSKLVARSVTRIIERLPTPIAQ